MAISKKFQVQTIIEKLPASWIQFAQSLNHKVEILSLEVLMRSLRIEKNHHEHAKDLKPPEPIESLSKANLIEGHRKCSKLQHQNQFKKHLKPKTKIFKNAKVQGACFVCGKAGHKAAQCFHRKDNNHRPQNTKGAQKSQPQPSKPQANMMIGSSSSSERTIMEEP
uniref:Uncharacterized protein LOC105032889 n=1 Tax=Elaeis guineensis var. tenera TaxID=51953 RepID=A0A6J0PBS8_ELAGV|nr:uncharacterized protein LOC105032889 [Elaeis guineensis]